MSILKACLLSLGLMTSIAALADNVWQKIQPNALIVDVRSPEEYQQGHLNNAILIPHTEIASRIKELGADKNRQIVLYCRSGRRSGLALEVLQQQGFVNAINAGGYEELLRSQPK